MSLAANDPGKHLLGPSSLYSVLDNVSRRSGAEPELSAFDRLRKSQADRDAKWSALHNFETALTGSVNGVKRAGGSAGPAEFFYSGHEILKAVLDRAKPEALRVISAVISDDSRLGFTIAGKKTAFDIRGSGADKARLNRLSLAHDLSIEMVAGVKEATVEQIGRLRNAIFAALERMGSAVGDAEHAGGISVAPDVRNALDDLGLGTLVVGTRADGGNERLAVSDLTKDIAGHFPSRDRNRAGAIIRERLGPKGLGAAGSHPAAKLLGLASELRYLAPRDRQANFRADYTLRDAPGDGDVTFRIRLGDREIVLPPVPADDHAFQVTRGIVADGLRADIAAATLRGNAAADANAIADFSAFAGPIIAGALDKAPPHISPESLERIADALRAAVGEARTAQSLIAGNPGEAADRVLRQHLAQPEIDAVPTGAPDREAQVATIEIKHGLRAPTWKGREEARLAFQPLSRADEAAAREKNLAISSREALIAQQDEKVADLKRFAANALFTNLDVSFFSETRAGGSAWLMMDGLPLAEAPWLHLSPEFHQRPPSASTTLSLSGSDDSGEWGSKASMPGTGSISSNAPLSDDDEEALPPPPPTPPEAFIAAIGDSNYATAGQLVQLVQSGVGPSDRWATSEAVTRRLGEALHAGDHATVRELARALGRYDLEPTHKTWLADRVRDDNPPLDIRLLLAASDGFAIPLRLRDLT